MRKRRHGEEEIYYIPVRAFQISDCNKKCNSVKLHRSTEKFSAATFYLCVAPVCRFVDGIILSC